MNNMMAKASAAAFIACLALGFFRWTDARAATGREVELNGLRSLKQGGNACGNFDFKFNTDFPSGNPMNNGRQAITANNEECCAFCKNTDGCKTWTRIKWNTRYNKKGECWLRDHTPKEKSCNHCDSGTAKDGKDFLDSCENDGKIAGSFAVRGACSTLKSICPPAKVGGAPRDEAPKFAQRTSIGEVTKRVCNVLFENACKKSGSEASVNDKACHDILTHGPGVATENCPDFFGAHDIFSAQLENLCEFDGKND